MLTHKENSNQKFLIDWILYAFRNPFKNNCRCFKAIAIKIQLKFKRCIKHVLFINHSKNSRSEVRIEMQKKEEPAKESEENDLKRWKKHFAREQRDCSNRSIIIVAVRSVIIAARWSTLIAVIAHAIIPIHGNYHEWWLLAAPSATKCGARAHIFISTCTINDGVQSENRQHGVWIKSDAAGTRWHRSAEIVLSFTVFSAVFAVAFLLQWPFFSFLLFTAVAFCKLFLLSSLHNSRD